MSISLRPLLGFALLSLPTYAQNVVVPVLNDQIPDQSEQATFTNATIELADYFGTEPILDDMVRLEGNYQDDDGNLVTANLDFLLFSERTPVTRDNFLGYINRGDYLTSFVHRSVSGFVIQGGGFTVTQGDGNLQVGNVATQAAIINEFGISNTERTISMAKSGGNPDSATSQWFVSLGANSDNLDNQNGGFTVFGRISQSTFANAQLLDPATPDTPFRLADLQGAFSSTPIHQSAFNSSPPILTQGDFFRIDSTTRVPVPASEAGSSTALTYAITSPDLTPDFAASISGSALQVNYLSPTRGALRNYTVTATDSVGNEVEDTFAFSVSISYEMWRNQVFTVEQQNDDLISGPMADPNGDGRTNLQAYAQDIDPFEEITSEFLEVIPERDNNRVLLSFRSNINTTSVDFFIEESDDLITWTRASSTDLSEIPSPRGRQVSVSTLGLNDAESASRKFYRLAFVLVSE